MQNNKKFLLAFFIIFFAIYRFVFTISKAHFICNENECKIQYLNTLGQVRRTTDINWNDYKGFEMRPAVNHRILRKDNTPLRKKIYWTVYARLQDNSEINLFRLASRDEYKTRKIVKFLNQQLKQDSTANIDIIYR